MTAARTDVEQATTYQRMAADPRATRLASANAGSGKTKVLVERVSRLLWDGADPDKILCLTYTKAAASEMQSRLFDTLGKWSIMGEDDLNAALDKLLGETGKRSQEKLGKARQLFARALETPDGLKVQTIHAFCERVLARFPIEAGILPGFEPMEDADVISLRSQIEEDIYKAAWAEPDSDLAGVIRHLSSEKADKTLSEIFRWIAHNGEAVRRWREAGGVSGLAQALKLSEIANVSDIYKNAWTDDLKVEIKHAAQDLLGSSNANDVKKANDILGALTHSDLREAFEIYANIFLTQSGALRKTPVTLKAPDTAQAFFGSKHVETTSEALRVLQVSNDIVAAGCLEMTRAVYIIADVYAAKYERAKRARRWLDFNDQITLVKNLLVQTEVADWVRYKLDGGIGHILVDEAQDTAPDQWDIIEALKSGFTLPDPDWPHGKPKTFFAVGDEKQSIYSFQGARPEKFIEKIRDYVTSDNALSVKMNMSFRSAPEVLRVVDAVFADQQGLQRMFDPEKVDIASEIVQHTAFRSDKGLVELWPISPHPDDVPDEVPWDTTPVDAPSQTSSREKLASAVAGQIKFWLDNEEPIFDRENGLTRAMQAGDILILVRRRNEFFDAVIRNLKSAGVPVAGADRLVLKDSMAVKDLLALTRFALLPSDDLSLAEVLKSPFFNFTEDELFDVAAQRGDVSLWAALTGADFEKAKFAVTDLKSIMAFAGKFAPYEFYARVLDMTGPGGESRLKQIYKRLGIEAKDPIEAFLARALAHQRRGAPSLQHFLQSFEDDDQDIKREMEAASGEVRVMTVHGAKGLEAPVVFLPDTTQKPSSPGGPGIYGLGEGFAYIPSAASTPLALTSLREQAKARDMEEFMRLLYVAMTRAESRLVICGFEAGRKGGTGFAPESWYGEVKTAMDDLDCFEIDTPFGKSQAYGGLPESALMAVNTAEPTAKALPDWIFRPAARESFARRKVTPSHLLAPQPAAESAVRSPSQPDRFRRGNLIHKLLEVLPDLAPQDREGFAKTYLNAQLDIAEVMRGEIYDEVLSVLRHPEFAEIFAPGSRAEVSLAGRGGALPDGMFLNAQIDRLAVTDDAVFIVDYKSNRPPPTRQEDVPEVYWGQMAAYRELVREIYPGRMVKCGLLWTDGPFMMHLDDKRLDVALTLIPAVPTLIAENDS